MKKEYADKWIEALRSGKYEQGQGTLRTKDDKFCCLGVLCDLIEPERWTFDLKTREWSNGEVSDDLPSPRPSTATLPTDIVAEVGIRTSSGKFTKGGVESTLWWQNDSGRTFDEISNIIEQHWETL